MELFFSIIIPVYNRPEEIRELLDSFTSQTYQGPYEIIIVEDGSSFSSEKVIEEFEKELPIKYFFKKNTGPGDSRNYGMTKAEGNYFLLLDSDCLVPSNYLSVISNSLDHSYADCFGGPDGAHSSFSKVQKAINFAMTSWITTGGIRGHKNSVDRFQPRSFNMGLSKKAFQTSGGFGNIHPGEDPDLSLRLKKGGFRIKLIPEAMVYHKRRIDFKKFYTQVRKFGMVRPILNKWHPGSSKLTYWFPTVFCLGFLAMLFALIINNIWGLYILMFYLVYFSLIFMEAILKNKSLEVGFMAIFATIIQFVGYGTGFLKSIILTTFSKKRPEQLFPGLFFEKK